ncbi:hypothetical protein RYX36_013144, partial [Vicia faba]
FDSDHNFSFSDGHKGNYIDVAQLFAKALGKTLASLNVNDQKIGKSIVYFINSIIDRISTKTHAELHQKYVIVDTTI